MTKETIIRSFLSAYPSFFMPFDGIVKDKSDGKSYYLLVSTRNRFSQKEIESKLAARRLTGYGVIALCASRTKKTGYFGSVDDLKKRRHKDRIGYVISPNQFQLSPIQFKILK